MEQHLLKSKEMLNKFKTNEVLYMELMDQNMLDAPEKLPAIIKLSNMISLLETDCGDAISRLEQETKEMIGLVCLARSHSKRPLRLTHAPGV